MKIQNTAISVTNDVNLYCTLCLNKGNELNVVSCFALHWENQRAGPQSGTQDLVRKTTLRSTWPCVAFLKVETKVMFDLPFRQSVIAQNGYDLCNSVHTEIFWLFPSPCRMEGPFRNCNGLTNRTPPRIRVNIHLRLVHKLCVKYTESVHTCLFFVYFGTQ